MNSNFQNIRHDTYGYTCVPDLQSLDALVRGKELELEQAAEAYRNLQWLKQQSEEKERSTLREKDAIINQLQAALQARSQESQVKRTRTHCFWLFAGLFPNLERLAHVDKPVPLVLFCADTALSVCACRI